MAHASLTTPRLHEALLAIPDNLLLSHPNSKAKLTISACVVDVVAAAVVAAII